MPDVLLHSFAGLLRLKVLLHDTHFVLLLEKLIEEGGRCSRIHSLACDLLVKDRVYQVGVGERHRVDVYEVKALTLLAPQPVYYLQGSGSLTGTRHTRNVKR